MRNDAHDELDHVPSLRAEQRDQDDIAYHSTSRSSGARPSAPVKTASTGPLWALVGALVIALGGLGWWSFQQISLMEQQLVATQESFARISEEAAGRIQAITGKVVATESSVTSGSEALKLELKQHAGRLAELSRQHESKLAELNKLLQSAGSTQGEQGKTLEQLSGALKAKEQSDAKLQTTLSSLSSDLASLKSEQANLKTALAGQGKLEERLSAVRTELDGLKKQGNPSQAIARVEQDLLVLKSEVETRAGAGGTAEFDAFRAQVTRNISTLQAQVQNLQQQLNAR
ncbi:ATPase [Pseudomonas sp. 5P_3.1_Bac2]|uniref:ATPase n=1 Tax=Pseudomonas sp. 5P_3.1_Bac2 TaxID=2971617 RepID=UPI0021C5BEB3|nr:ATPase [Pseudomonas sp. 5P_3.1_Bac2]MCU1715525.1 ATPase [Pseudomonas sp. 5P_3.1_Bac2]